MYTHGTYVCALSGHVLYMPTNVVFSLPSGAGRLVKRQDDNENTNTSCPNLDVIRGRDGRDGLTGAPGATGKDGRNGDKGMKGDVGPMGPPGPQGPTGATRKHGCEGDKGTKGDVGPVGPSGPKGSSGATGNDGRDGEKGMKGDAGPMGPPGPQASSGGSGGSVYIRWGRTTCPNTTGTELVYDGLAAGSYYTHTGGGANYQCIPKIPKYSNYYPGRQGMSPLYGTEYQQDHGAPLPNIEQHNVPCAVCSTSRSKLFMLPARNECPTTWTLEYSGYLMTTHYAAGHYRTTYECIDKEPESVPGYNSNTDGALFYHVEATCNGIPCPPYDAQKELTCAVCTK